MRQLKIQDRKLSVIEQLIIINDDKVFKQVEEIINNSLHRPQLKRFTKQKLLERAKLSNQDIANGEVFTQAEVEKISQNW